MALTINDPSKYISTLLDTGADAMKNLYHIEFDASYDASIAPSGTNINSFFGDSAAVINKTLTIRSGDFTPPTATHSKAPISYMTTSLDVPTSGFSLERKFNISFRLDSNYKVYEYLKVVQGLTSKPTKGFASTATLSDMGIYLTVNVYSLNEAVSNSSQLTPSDTNIGALDKDNSLLLYSFKNCWVSEVNIEDTYSYTTSPSQLKVNASVCFGDFEDPQNLLLKSLIV